MSLRTHQGHKQPPILRFSVYSGFLILLFLIVRPYFFSTSRTLSPIPEEKTKKTTLLHFFKKEKNADDLKELVKKAVNNEWTNYSVLVQDYNSPFRMSINESLIYNAASVNKVPILAAIYDRAKRGEIDFDKVVTLQQDDIQDYGTGKIRYDAPGTTYTVKTLIQLMIQKSDNTAAFILGNYILGLDAAQAYVTSLGMKQTDIVDNKTSNKDMAILFEKIHNNTITTPALSEELQGLLTNSDFEDRLPALLPKGATVMHKIGTGTGAVHDAGIVSHGNTEYYIGIFTSDILDEEQAAKLLSEVSKVVYDFMYEK